jgi:hypothetical protein
MSSSFSSLNNAERRDKDFSQKPHKIGTLKFSGSLISKFSDFGISCQKEKHIKKRNMNIFSFKQALHYPNSPHIGLASARLTKGAENVRRAKRRARRARLTTALVRSQSRAASLVPSVTPSERTPRSGGENEGYLGASRRLAQGVAVVSRGRSQPCFRVGECPDALD